MIDMAREGGLGKGVWVGTRKSGRRTCLMYVPCATKLKAFLALWLRSFTCHHQNQNRV